MKKRVFFHFLLAMLLFAALSAPLPAQASDTATTKLSVKSSVSFRSAPSTSSTVMRYLKTGEVVTAVEYVNPSWFKIKDTQGVVGYVTSSDRYITELSNARIVSSVSFRTGPSTSYSRMRYLKSGEEVLVLEKMNDYWFRVKDAGGVTGYVSSSSTYIDTDFSVTGVILPLEERIESVISAGMKYIGTPYEFGSTRFNSSTFDCSDFTQTSFWEGSRTLLSGDSRGQGSDIRSAGKAVWDWHNLKRGDLIFFMDYKGSSWADYADVERTTETITHVGIYLGDGQILHTYSIKSGGVRIDSIAGTQWEKRFLFGGSVF
jgi:cell wall-associated NlpC family hydrolase